MKTYFFPRIETPINSSELFVSPRHGIVRDDLLFPEQFDLVTSSASDVVDDWKDDRQNKVADTRLHKIQAIHGRNFDSKVSQDML